MKALVLAQTAQDELLFYFDEGRFGLKPSLGRYWAERGRQAVITIKPGYSNFYIFAAVSPLNGEAFILSLPRVNTDLMNLYLAHLAATYPEHTITLVMDQAGWHRANDLAVPASINISYLPAYSPELNPVERLWRWLRTHACRNRLFADLDQVNDAVCTAIKAISSEQYGTICACSYLS